MPDFGKLNASEPTPKKPRDDFWASLLEAGSAAAPAVGAGLGGLAGTFLAPGLGTMGGAAIGGALGTGLGALGSQGAASMREDGIREEERRQERENERRARQMLVGDILRGGPR